MLAPAPLPRTITNSAAWCLFLALAFFTCNAWAAPKWKPVDPAELSDSRPHVDPDAGAEILLREVEYNHSSTDEAKDTYYVRVKVYNQRGVDDFSKIELPYDSESSIRNIMARTIKPDGTIVELNAKEVYDREVIKAGKERVKVKSFAPPGVEPGAIVEYRYTEIIDGPGIYMSLLFQTAQPARKVRYKVKLLDLPAEVASRFRLKAMSFNCPDQPLKPDNDGWLVFDMSNLGAVKDEPFQPPEINTRSSILIYYALEKEIKSSKEYWALFGKELHDRMEKTAKLTKAIRAAVETIVAKTDSEEIKLQKIYDYCRTKIVNRYSDTSGLSAKQLEKLKENETATDTLKSGSGTHDDINILFAALTRAAGLETHFVACNDRTRILFNPKLVESSFMLPDVVVSVRVGDQTKYFDPGCLYLPFGLVAWENTATYSIASDKTAKAEPFIIPGPVADASSLLRKAELTLDAEGTLEGDVTETYSGYREVGLKHTLDGKTANEREIYIREDVQEYQKLAEVTHVVVENAAAPLAQLKITYHLRIPDYAEKTGSRLFMVPAVFQKGAPPWFEATMRSTAVIFKYCFTTRDDLQIKLPEGYSLEEASSPGDLSLGVLGTYYIKLLYKQKANSLNYQRKFSLNGISFDKKFYPLLKEAFEAVHKNDNHTLTLKLKEATPEPGAASAAKPDKTAESEVDSTTKN